MYQGTYARNPRKPRKRAVRMNKTAILLLAVILLAGAVIGTTVAYLTTKTNAIENVFTYAQVSCAVDEKFDGTTKSDVRIKNTGNIDAYIRVKIVQNWLDGNDNIAASVPQGYSVETINLGAGWIVGNDGYYYYPNPVAAQEYTPYVIESYKAVTPPNPEYTLQVEIIASAIQSRPVEAVKAAWGSDVPLNFN